MRHNGFTLVEMMVVIAVMALLAGSVLLVAGAPGSSAADAASRFASRVAAARDQAIVTSRPTSAWVTQSGYGFEEYRSGKWEVAGSPTLRQRNWDSGTQVTLAAGAEARMQIRFDSLGLPESPLTLTLARDGQSARVTVSASGDIEVL